MKPGQIAETGIWITGEETEEELRKWKMETIEDIFDVAQFESGTVFGEIEFETLDPSNERCPSVPSHIHGAHVQMLVAFAPVLRYQAGALPPMTFVQDLEKDDLELLRKIARKAWMRDNPGHRLTDYECDSVIEKIGPKTAMKVLKEAVDNGLNS